MGSEKSNPFERAIYLESILENLRNINEVADLRANVLVAVSGIILSIALSQIVSDSGAHKIAFILISLFSFVAMFLTIGVIRPKIGKVKKNSMYYQGILESSSLEYEKYLAKVANNSNTIVVEYAREIYTFSEELKSRYKMIRLAADILAVGLAIGLILIIVL